jgi:hypothetical protein
MDVPLQCLEMIAEFPCLFVTLCSPVGEWFVVLDTPLLFESGRLVSWMKKIIVVYW